MTEGELYEFAECSGKKKRAEKSKGKKEERRKKKKRVRVYF